MKPKLKYQSGKSEWSITATSTKEEVEQVVSTSPYFQKLKLIRNLNELNSLGMDDQTICGTLGMDIRTIKGFRKGSNLQKRSFLKLLKGVDEIKKQLEELGEIV